MGEATRLRVRAGPVSLTVAFALVGVAGFLAVKWWPYGHKLGGLLARHGWAGGSVLDAAAGPGDAPSVGAAWGFALAYGRSVWPALVVALVVAAGIEVLVPRRALSRLLTGRGPTRTAALAGALALPWMLCTCCTAPVANSLRRRGVPASGMVAFWLGNPLLNPAVLAFLALTLPWRYALLRLGVGALLVFGASPLLGRLGPRNIDPAPVADAPPAAGAALAADAAPMTGGVSAAGAAPSAGVVSVAGTRGVPPIGTPAPVGALLTRYLAVLARYALVLVPEYLAVVVVVGALRGWLLPLSQPTGTVLVATLLAAVAGTILVVPTAGEIPVIAGLLAAGFAPPVAGALLIALPAVSLPSMVMVGRTLAWRRTLATAGAVCAGALLAGALAAAW